jgi:serine/threonine-protein kinase HipA
MRRIVAEADKDVRELFRRICFNALISNLDDHPRNHALLARKVDWALSPAYDLTPSPVVSLDRRDLALACGDQGRFANAKNILSQHARFLLQKDEAEKIITDTKAQVSHWYDTVRAWESQRRTQQRSEAHSSILGFLTSQVCVTQRDPPFHT